MTEHARPGEVAMDDYYFIDEPPAPQQAHRDRDNGSLADWHPGVVPPPPFAAVYWGLPMDIAWDE